MKVTFYIDGRELPQDLIDDWERQRSIAVAHELQSLYGVRVADAVFDEKQDIASVRAALTEAKLQLDPDQIRTKLKGKLAFSAFASKFMNIMSFGNVKPAVTEIVCEDCTAEYMVEKLNDLFLKNSPENRALSLSGAPDHYVLEAHPGDVQEIIEIAGGVYMQFFNKYGDESKVHYPKEESYPLQMVAVARTKNGAVAGAIRHQYRNEGDGFRAKCADEFPAVMPRSLIRTHQMHLACEFGIWYRTFGEEAKGKSKRA